LIGRSALRVTNEVQRRWGAFSRTGDPGDDWPVYTDADRAVMVFDRKSHLEFDPHLSGGWRGRAFPWRDDRGCDFVDEP